MAKTTTWTLTAKTVAEDGETVYQYESGENVVKFQASKGAYPWMFHRSTNVPGAVRNKVLGSFLSQTLQKGDITSLNV